MDGQLSCTRLTTAPVGVFVRVHDRRPLLLQDSWAAFIAVGSALFSSADQTFGGFVRDRDETMREGQGAARGGLRWTETVPGLWEATDPVTLAAHETEARPY